MVKAGDVVKVRVVEVDVARKRIGLSMRKEGGGREPAPKPVEKARRPAGPPPKPRPEPQTETGSFGAALQEALKGR